ncbi:MAG: ADP-glyceromanno-heptose 6-epimerase [Gammaproteobacteria bacterium]|nr:ADP-glyceromanno-heptose 6-epimerase [Gammaproteobacteria bacterium]
MLVVTGAAGFIGSNLIVGLNKKGREDILAVDDMTDGTKFANLVDCKLYDYQDKDAFLKKILNNEKFPEKIEAIFHQGACSATTEWNGKYMLENNFEYSKILLHYCIKHKIPFIYASSAATYGNSTTFAESPENEKPLNVYGYSKLLFDQYVRRFLSYGYCQIVGLRYFNVYGPHESHKGSMASVAFHFNNQIKEKGVLNLFKGTDGYNDGEQRRDFVYVDDITAINLWFWQNSCSSGIYNAGTGNSQTFNDVANAVIAWHGKGKIHYIDFPEQLKGRYQSFTEADITQLRREGFDHEFNSVEQGVKQYLDWLNAESSI